MPLSSKIAWVRHGYRIWFHMDLCLGSNLRTEKARDEDFRLDLTYLSSSSGPPAIFQAFFRFIRLWRIKMSNSNDSKKDLSLYDAGIPQPDRLESSVRPPIDYHSPGAFISTSFGRFKSLWTRRFTLSLLAGQVVSLCITCTNVATTELVMRNWSLPTTQTFFLWVPAHLTLSARLILRDRYFSLFCIYTPYTIYQCQPFTSSFYVYTQIFMS